MKILKNKGMKIMKKNKGFSLLETLMALVIISACIGAIITAYNTGIFLSHDIENMDKAINIAREQMENIKNMTYKELDKKLKDDDDYYYFNSDFDPNSFFIEKKVIGKKGQDPMQIWVRVEWDVPGGQADLNLTTLIADY